MPETMCPIDIALAVPLIWGAIRGFRRGFILEVKGLIALFLGAYAALFGSDITAGWLDAQYAIGKEYLGIVSFALTFLVVALRAGAGRQKTSAKAGGDKARKGRSC